MKPSEMPDGLTNVKVLMYHRIVSDRELSDQYWFCVHADDFRRQLELLERWGFASITFDDYRLFRKGELDLPKRAVILTFDDGYLDTYELAFPLLQEHRMKAVVFVLGERHIKTNVWDERLGFPTAPLMEGGHIVDLHLAGFEIGSHSMVHSDLTTLSEDRLWHEVTRSRMLLEILINDKVQTFSYPYGITNPKVKQTVANAGYDFACSGETGAPVFGSDPLEIKRIKIANTTGSLGLAIRLLTPFEYLTTAYAFGRSLFVNGKNGANGEAGRKKATVKNIVSTS